MELVTTRLIATTEVIVCDGHVGVFDEIFNQGKFQVADEIYAPHFKNHGLQRSVDLKTDQEAVHAEKKAFPDLRMSVQEMVAEGDKWQ